MAHGVKTTETFNQESASVIQANTLPVYFGTAPIHLAADPYAVTDRVILANNMPEFKRKFGYVDDWESYTLCEAAFAHFSDEQQGPIAFVNVLDATTDVTVTAPASVTLIDGAHTIAADGVLKDKVIVTSSDSNTTYVLNTDYTLTFNASGRLVLAVITGGAITGTDIRVGYTALNPSAVTASKLIGGTDVTTGVRTGLELVEEVFQVTKLVPNLILAPGYSDNPVVASVMQAKAQDVNGLFEAYAVTDLDASIKYMDVAEWKKENGYDSMLNINTYPLFTNKGKTFRSSTIAAVRMLATDGANGGFPVQTPSNQRINVDGMVYKDGSPVFMPYDQANVLNDNGIVTAINWQDGYRLWGNKTGAYPEFKDAQRSFIPVRRMFSYVKNNLVLNYWSKVDNPLNKRLVESVLDDANIWINGLVGANLLVGGRVEFNSSDNPAEQLSAGKMIYRVIITPPGPAEDIEFIVSYDSSYYAAMFAA
ncbi:phage tail sheath family protein [Paenibacillus silvae]|uniref:phage tail sheath family protein n=1 Tax=Paenibacillus silvae TaxID=1325358 RepID=UPI0025A0E277|nr:phage tail sheath family protein [Paenibacillus silvae]MDM5278803.1 phage tail sheath family protein [Paenibacillus silvae]